jgi:hypothetical protein
MRSRALALAAILSLACSFAAFAETAKATPSSELIERAKALDGQKLAFEGEAIGESLPRGEYAWVNVEGDSYAIGVWLPRSELAKIERYGSYSWKGDRLRVVGNFHRACPEHGGDLDIHAASIEILERGSPIPHPTAVARIIAAVILLASGVASFALWRRRERKLRPKPAKWH